MFGPPSLVLFRGLLLAGGQRDCPFLCPYSCLPLRARAFLSSCFLFRSGLLLLVSSYFTKQGLSRHVRSCKVSVPRSSFLSAPSAFPSALPSASPSPSLLLLLSLLL